MHTLFFKKKYPKRQTMQGFALASVLIMLLIITAIGATAVKVGMFDQDSIQLQHDQSTSRRRAELAMTDAIDRILCTKSINGNDINVNIPPINGKDNFLDIGQNNCQRGFCGIFNAGSAWDNLEKNTASINDNWFEPYGRSTGNNSIASTQGRYIIEAVSTNLYTGTSTRSDNVQYRITAVGFADYNANAFSKLQIVFRPKNQTCRYNPSASNIFY